MPKKLEDEKPKEASSEEQDALSKIMFMPRQHKSKNCVL